MAHPQVQVPPVGHACAPGGAAWDHAYLSTLPSASQNVCASAPSDRKKAISWGAWLCCSAPTSVDGARDYAASVNIARLGMAFLITYQQTQRYLSYRMADSSVKPALYSSVGASLLLPTQGFTARPSEGKHIYYAGWSYATSLRTSHPKNLLAVLSTSQLRKYVLQSV